VMRGAGTATSRASSWPLLTKSKPRWKQIIFVECNLGNTIYSFHLQPLHRPLELHGVAELHPTDCAHRLQQAHLRFAHRLEPLILRQLLNIRQLLCTKLHEELSIKQKTSGLVLS
jgi:hypothetical protein